MRLPEIDRQAAEWLEFVERVRRNPSIGFETQWRRFLELSDARDPALGPLPTWVPDADRIAGSNLERLAADLGAGSYVELHRRSVEHRAEFWRRVIDQLGLVFERPP